jgi:hypothetical protein
MPGRFKDGQAFINQDLIAVYRKLYLIDLCFHGMFSPFKISGSSPN